MTVNCEKSNELQRLKEENNRLKDLLTRHGIQWEESVPAAEPPSAPQETHHLHLSASEKVALFRRLFRGRTDVYPLRWDSAEGRSGYSPVCGNEWKSGVCNKSRIKCGVCDHRLLLPVTDQVMYDHLAGQHTVGVYPLLADDSCCFLAVDFDKVDWREDARALMQSCHELKIPAALEISRSGNGAHIWIFFSDPVPAREARQLGAALISHTCNRTRQLLLSSYDRLFPNQDTLPKGGFGNLIALPLQKQPRERGCSVFVDESYIPYPDQWAFLASITPMPRFELENAILRVTGGKHTLDVAFVAEEDERKPWQGPTPVSNRISGPLPESLKLVLANQVFIAKADLPQQLTNRLLRLAAFQNPEFYKAQAMRLPVWNKPRIIDCAENFPQHIGLPRGCLDAVQERLTSFLELPKDMLGLVCGGKKKLTGKIDIAVMQSLSRLEDLAELFDSYGQIIVDECHHLSAFSFEAILKQAKARYVIGLTATPFRRDGHHPIIFMQCGPIRHSAPRPENAPAHLEVLPRNLAAPEIPTGSDIQDIFRILTNDTSRNRRIAQDVLFAYQEGRKILVLTERTEHLELLREAIDDDIKHCFVLHGRLSKKQRASTLAELVELDGSTPLVLLATGRLIGEGFDHPPLDTLVLAMPISWKGTLQQYAGRLHREHSEKQDVRIYDYVEQDQPQLVRMWDKRQRGYHAMGYQILSRE